LILISYGDPFTMPTILNLQVKAMLGLSPSDVIDLQKYSAVDLADTVGYYVKSEFFDVLADIWSDFKLASRHPKCARTVICVRNSPQSVRSSLGLKQATTRSARYIQSFINSTVNSSVNAVVKLCDH